MDTAEAPNGDIIAAGYSNSSDGDFPVNKGRYGDFVIARYASDGSLVWLNTYGGKSDDWFTTVIVASNGDIIAAGCSNSFDGVLSTNKGFDDFVIARFKSDGTLLWMKNYGGSGLEIFNSVIEASNGDIIAAGGSDSSDGDLSTNKGAEDFVIARFKSDGSLIWITSCGGSGEDIFTAVMETSSGDIIAAGNSDSSDGDLPGNKGYADLILARFTSDGSLAWIKNYGGSDTDVCNSAVMASNGDIVLVGGSWSNDGDLEENRGSGDFIVARFTADGDLIWMKSCGGKKSEDFFGVAMASDGDIIAVGGSSSSTGDLSGNKGGYDFTVARFTSKGALLWMESYGGSEDEDLYAVFETSDGDIIAVGGSSSSDGDLPGNKGDNDAVIIRLTSDGKL
jgi:uncharacterized delta-60 repeat protein